MQKTKPQRNPQLLKMAQGRRCLLVAVDWCSGWLLPSDTTVAAHSNQSKHGKGMGRKADDQYTVWACHVCHSLLDQGKMSQEEKVAMWDVAHKRQIEEWRKIVNDQSETESARRAAQWAIDRV